MSNVIFTMDVEDPDLNSDGSYRNSVEMILDWLDEEAAPGTFFIVGSLAKTCPELVRKIASRGHELGLHGLHHVAIGSLSPADFSRQIIEGKSVLEQLCGKPVHGYRAPMFSLTSDTQWAVDRLASAGFEYSSSVLPAASPRYGFRGAPQSVFQWPCGLIEIPAPVMNQLGMDLPFLGGIYFRYFPNWLIESALQRVNGKQIPWFYCHPYDFYQGRSYLRMRDTPLWVNALLMLRRRNAFTKMKSLLTNRLEKQTLLDISRAFHVA